MNYELIFSSRSLDDEAELELIKSATDCYRNELAKASARVIEAKVHPNRDKLLQEVSCTLAANLVNLKSSLKTKLGFVCSSQLRLEQSLS